MPKYRKSCSAKLATQAGSCVVFISGSHANILKPLKHKAKCTVHATAHRLTSENLYLNMFLYSGFFSIQMSK